MLVLHSVVVVNKGFLALLFRQVLGFETSLTQSLSGRVVYFNSTGASALGQNILGVDFVEFIFL